MVEYMLTTVDNPYDPFDNFAGWWRYDTDHGYNTSGLLARIGRFSDALTDEENAAETKRAIDQIIKYDPLNIYKLVEKDVVTHENRYKDVVIPDEPDIEDELVDTDE